MTEKLNRIAILQELLECANNLYFWKFTHAMELEQTNCPHATFFESTLRFSGCSDRACAHFAEHDDPIMLTDALGLVWLADCIKVESTIHEIYLIGPAFSSDFSEKSLEKQMNTMNLSLSAKQEFMQQLHDVPVILFSVFQRYGIMLHYCLTGNKIKVSDFYLSQASASVPDDSFDRWKEDQIHGTWYYEQQMLKMVTEGDLHILEKMEQVPLNGRPGSMSPGNPLRQVKDEIIVLTALCTRAAIQGGVAPETAYTLSDYYVQMIEDTPLVHEVYSCAIEVIRDFVQRVHNAKQYTQYAPLTQRCIEYVSRNIYEKIRIEQMAADIGYAKNYLTAKFKEDTGINIRDYISQQKVEQAKLLLKSTQLPVSDIGDKLGFADSSYFSAVFKKWCGMQPTEYRNSLPQSDS